MVSKEKIKQLAKQCMFELTEDEVEAIEREFDFLIKEMNLINQIDTSNVDIMVTPYETMSCALRDDEEIYELDREDVLKNAPKTQDGYFVVPKVV